MPYYRKKPIPVEARLMLQRGLTAINHERNL